MRSSAATRNRIAPRIVSLITAVFEAGWQGIQQWVIAIKHRRDALRLADYDDHMLADVGLTRDNVSAALGGPFWRDPTAAFANGLAEQRRGKTL
jgi:uncharacterized protein YjiS (DUF1127 family)